MQSMTSWSAGDRNRVKTTDPEFWVGKPVRLCNTEDDGIEETLSGTGGGRDDRILRGCRGRAGTTPGDQQE